MAECFRCRRHKWLGIGWHREGPDLYIFCPRCWHEREAAREELQQAEAAEQAERTRLEAALAADLATAMRAVRGLALLASGDLGSLLTRNRGRLPATGRSESFLRWIVGLPGAMLERIVKEGALRDGRIAASDLPWFLQRAYPGEATFAALVDAAFASGLRDATVWRALLDRSIPASCLATQPHAALETALWYLADVAGPPPESAPCASDRAQVQDWLRVLARRHFEALDPAARSRLVAALTSIVGAPYRAADPSGHGHVGWSTDRLAECCLRLEQIGGEGTDALLRLAVPRFDPSYRQQLEATMASDSADHARAAQGEAAEWLRLRRRLRLVD